MLNINNGLKKLKKWRRKWIWRRQNFERLMEVIPPYRLLNEDPSKNYGRGGVNFIFILKGKKGAVTFKVMTNCYCLDDSEGWGYVKNRIGDGLFGPMMAWGIDVHSPHPHYEGQTPVDGCTWVPGDNCYLDGSALAGSELLQKWAKSDMEPSNEVIWKELEQWYKEHLLYPGTLTYGRSGIIALLNLLSRKGDKDER